MIGKGTERCFGYEWDCYREIIALHERQFVQWITPIPLSFFKGKRFLDAGCGIGRNSLWALRAGAASCYAFDYDERTVAVARKNLQGFANCEVHFESIYDLTRENEFDVAFCIGVIHHLARPEAGVERLVRALKSGGTLILWVYAHEGNERYLALVDPLRRYLTSRLPYGVTRYLSVALTALLKCYLVFPHRDAYFRELKRRSFRHMEAMVFDQLLPSISKYFRRSEVLELIRGLPVELVHLTHTNGMSWTVVAKKQ
jgi:SAM-dependent methyltransferase